ncbi:MAG: hypothetical protein M2R45_05371 [Verrucomicrobia subdivision 3 bacterium]|nr:hypothetical protein [Limisphaerales bacterium]MCS1417846.1 hypothetical protein [Limisphaerales bacterium]
MMKAILSSGAQFSFWKRSKFSQGGGRNFAECITLGQRFILANLQIAPHLSPCFYFLNCALSVRF